MRVREAGTRPLGNATVCRAERGRRAEKEQLEGGGGPELQDWGAGGATFEEPKSWGQKLQRSDKTRSGKDPPDPATRTVGHQHGAGLGQGPAEERPVSRGEAKTVKGDAGGRAPLCREGDAAGVRW